MTEKWKKCLDSNVALLVALSKPFYCLPNSLLIARLYGYEFDIKLYRILKRLFKSQKVNDNTPFAMGSWELEVINEIESVTETLTLRFRNDCMKVNSDMFHPHRSDNKIHQVDICNEKLSSTCSENFWWITIDNKLSFEEHIEGLCKKVS